MDRIRVCRGWLRTDIHGRRQLDEIASANKVSSVDNLKTYGLELAIWQVLIIDPTIARLKLKSIKLKNP